MKSSPKSPITVALLAALLTLAASCATPPAPADSIESTPARDIPGITDSEIHAVESLQAQNASFIAESRSWRLVGCAALLFCVIALLFVLYMRSRREKKRLEIRVQECTAELDEQKKLLEYMSLTDQLTGLPNRRNFDMRLEIEWRIAIRETQHISLLMLDVDHFKSVNDRYGHQAGDDVLRAVAEIIKGTLKRPGDFLARWGGEEFAILLSNTDAAGAKKLAESIRGNIEKSKISLGGIDISLTASIGVNTRKPRPGDPREALITVADRELYTAKKSCTRAAP